jgi:Zn-dependent oligopeptidase
MDDQPEHTDRDLSPEVAAQVAAARRKLDQIAARPTERSIHDKLGELETTVKRLAQVVSTLALTVSRLADERLGDHEPTGADPPTDPVAADD